MTLARRLALLEGRRAQAGAETLHPDLVRWLADRRDRHGSYAPANVTAADLALWAEHAPAINLPDLLDRFACVDAMS
jgi:hypothetical protein